MHFIRHKCMNTGEVYYTYIVFDSNVYTLESVLSLDECTVYNMFES